MEIDMDKVQKLVEENGKGKGNLVGVDGHAFSLMGYTSKALRKQGWKKEDIDFIMKQARCGDYNNLIRVLASTLEE